MARYYQARGGALARRALAEAVEVEDGRAVAVRYVQRPQERGRVQQGEPGVPQRAPAEAVVAAVPWHAVGRLLPEPWRTRAPFGLLGGLGGSPIVSVEMWLDRVVVDRAMVGLRASEVEWVFDKGRLYGREGAPQHLAFIVSAARRSLERANAELTASAEASLRRYFPAMRGARVTRALVLREPSATFASRPGLDALRPGAVTPLAGLYLAGDWTDTGLPAVIEGAVRSGRRAALAAAGSSPVRASGGAPPPAPWPGTTVASAG
jgi:uncharacterized protein with NAD-binding domain and iron-sulfur cluster